MPSGPMLNLNQAPRTAVFRQLVSFVRNDPTIKRIVRPTSIRAWDGLPQDAEPFSPAIAPCIRMTPTNGPDKFWSPGATVGTLFVQVEMLVQGLCSDDLLNLWWAVVRAIYPAAQSDTNASIRALVAAGAYCGLAEFTLPVFDADPENFLFAGVGQIKIDVNNVLLTG